MTTQPAQVPHPGVILARELKVRDISQQDFAKLLRVSPQFVNDLVHSRRRVGVNVALKLEDLWGPSAEMWLGLQMDYDLFMARKEDDNE